MLLNALYNWMFDEGSDRHWGACVFMRAGPTVPASRPGMRLSGGGWPVLLAVIATAPLVSAWRGVGSVGPVSMGVRACPCQCWSSPLIVCINSVVVHLMLCYSYKYFSRYNTIEKVCILYHVDCLFETKIKKL